jgi:hypothetical protein
MLFSEFYICGIHGDFFLYYLIYVTHIFVVNNYSIPHLILYVFLRKKYSKIVGISSRLQET